VMYLRTPNNKLASVSDGVGGVLVFNMRSYLEWRLV